MRTFLISVLVLVGAAQRAGADMVPEDPYAEHGPGESTRKPPPVRPRSTVRPAPAASAPAAATPATTVAPAASAPAASAAPTDTPPATATAPAAIIRLAPPQTATADDAIIDVGSVTLESGPLPAPFDADPRLAGFRAGYVCEVIGVLWTYFHIEDCRPAAIHGAMFDDATKPLVAAIQTRYARPVISLWGAHGWKLTASGIGLLAFAWVVWRRRTRASQRTAAKRRHTQFHGSVIDPAVAHNHMAAWECGSPAPGQSMVAVAYHGYGPYGRVTSPPGQVAVVTLPYDPLPVANHQAPAPFEPPSVAPQIQYPCHSWAVAAAHDVHNTLPSVPGYQAQIEREHAMQLARGSQAEELDRTRRWLAIQPDPATPTEPLAVRATRLRHPPVPKPPHLAMLMHMPNRLS